MSTFNIYKLFNTEYITYGKTTRCESIVHVKYESLLKKENWRSVQKIHKKNLKKLWKCLIFCMNSSVSGARKTLTTL